MVKLAGRLEALLGVLGHGLEDDLLDLNRYVGLLEPGTGRGTRRRRFADQHLVEQHAQGIHVRPLVGKGALDGAFWGMLFGLIFFVPFFGMAIGAAMGALTGKFADYGINDDFIEEVQSKVTEGTSALFVLSGAATEDKVREAFAGVKMELIQSNLTEEHEAELRAAFGEGKEETSAQG